MPSCANKQIGFQISGKKLNEKVKIEVIWDSLSVKKILGSPRTFRPKGFIYVQLNDFFLSKSCLQVPTTINMSKKVKVLQLFHLTGRPKSWQLGSHYKFSLT